MHAVAQAGCLPSSLQASQTRQHHEGERLEEASSAVHSKPLPGGLTKPYVFNFSFSLIIILLVILVIILLHVLHEALLSG